MINEDIVVEKTLESRGNWETAERFAERVMRKRLNERAKESTDKTQES